MLSVSSVWSWNAAWIGEVAHWIALIPLAFLLWRSARHQYSDAAWWWLAVAFAVSWIADTAADALPRSHGWIPSLLYPVTQTALVGAVLLPRRRAWMLLGLLLGVAGASLAWRAYQGPDVVLRSVAWLAVVWIVVTRPELPRRLGMALLVYFGVGLVAWLAHAEWVTLATWYPYQATRLAGLVLFCRAIVKPTPTLAIVHDA